MFIILTLGERGCIFILSKIKAVMAFVPRWPPAKLNSWTPTSAGTHHVVWGLHFTCNGVTASGPPAIAWIVGA